MGWSKRLTLVWLLVSIALTLALTLLLWTVFGVAGFVGFLFLPFLFSGFRLFGPPRHEAGPRPSPEPSREEGPSCPVCDWPARDGSDRYCPRDGSLLR